MKETILAAKHFFNRFRQLDDSFRAGDIALETEVTPAVFLGPSMMEMERSISITLEIIDAFRKLNDLIEAGKFDQTEIATEAPMPSLVVIEPDVRAA